MDQSKESIEAERIEIDEPAQVIEKKVPTRDELKATGWTAKELDSAEKHGLLKDPNEPKKEEPSKEVVKAEPPAEEPKKEESPKPEPDQKRGSWPDFTFKTPEQEKAFMDAFGPGTPQRAMIWRMKNERKDRQRMQSERDQAIVEKRALEERLRALEGRVEPRQTVDAEGNAVDPDATPLTKREFLELQEQQRQDAIRQEQELRSRGQKVADALKDQEEYMKSIYPDYDATVAMAKEVLGNLDDLIDDPKLKSKVIRLVKDLQVAAANADQYGIEDYNAADISYEIGKLHPNYDKKPNGTNADSNGHIDIPDKANGSRHSPDQLKRIEQNTQRRNTSASITGGGRRVISPDEVTVADLIKMSPEQRFKFRQAHPEHYAKLRG